MTVIALNSYNRLKERRNILLLAYFKLCTRKTSKKWLLPVQTVLGAAGQLLRETAGYTSSL